MRGGDEAFLIDSPVLPDELDALPQIAEQSGFDVVGLLATHGDWDHLLGRLAFPQASLGVAESTAARLDAEPGAAARELRKFDAEFYIERAAPLQLGGVQQLPVPGRLDIGTAELELHPADGHTADGMAIWCPAARVLIAGDYLSPVEDPMVVDAAAYRATLGRLRPLVDQADWVVPGHGEPMARDAARAILEGHLTSLP